MTNNQIELAMYIVIRKVWRH